jgi:hypothetical protein
LGGRKRFFFEKKEAKNFASRARAIREGRRRTMKSFLLLFFKKEGLAAPFPGPLFASAWRA